MSTNNNESLPTTQFRPYRLTTVNQFYHALHHAGLTVDPGVNSPSQMLPSNRRTLAENSGHHFFVSFCACYGELNTVAYVGDAALVEVKLVVRGSVRYMFGIVTLQMLLSETGPFFNVAF